MFILKVMSEYWLYFPYIFSPGTRRVYIPLTYLKAVASPERMGDILGRCQSTASSDKRICVGESKQNNLAVGILYFETWRWNISPAHWKNRNSNIHAVSVTFLFLLAVFRGTWSLPFIMFAQDCITCAIKHLLTCKIWNSWLAVSLSAEHVCRPSARLSGQLNAYSVEWSTVAGRAGLGGTPLGPAWLHTVSGSTPLTAAPVGACGVGYATASMDQ